MNFRDFLNLAENLAKGASEAEWRTCVSRAYYGAFHVACDFLKVLGFRVPRSERGHSFVWLRLSNCGDDDVMKSGRSLNDLRGRRNASDYQERIAVSSAHANDALKSAQSIIKQLDAVLNQPIRSRVQEAIKRYEKDILKEVTWQ